MGTESNEFCTVRLVDDDTGCQSFKIHLGVFVPVFTILGSAVTKPGFDT